MNLFEIAQRVGYGARRDRRYRYLDLLTANLSMTRDEMVSYQSKLIRRLVTHAYDSSEFYRRQMDQIGLSPEDVRNKGDLRLMPDLSKSTIRANERTIFSTDARRRRMTLVTSGGSTGNQGFVWKSDYSVQMQRANSLRLNRLVGWEPSDRSVWLWGAPYEHEQLLGSVKARFGAWVNRRRIFNAYEYSDADYSRWVSEINRCGARVLYGYASIILDLGRFMNQEGLKTPSLELVISTTEALRERAAIERAFRCRLVDQYGCREVVAVAIEYQPGRMMVTDDTVALNIDDRGNILLTDLHSFGFPLINYRVGDIARQPASESESEIPCPFPFSVMRLSIGRETENFLTASGKIVSTSALATYISTKRIPFVSYQLVQRDYQDFVLRYVASCSFEIGDWKQLISAILSEYFGSDVTVAYFAVSVLPVEKSGKRLLFKREFRLE